MAHGYYMNASELQPETSGNLAVSVGRSPRGRPRWSNCYYYAVECPPVDSGNPEAAAAAAAAIQGPRQIAFYVGIG